MSAMQDYTISGTTEEWTITTPDGITITPTGDAAGTLNVNITYTDASLLNNATAHGILSVDFQPIIDKIASFGFHAPINLTVTNGMSVPIAGFDIMTYNDNMANPIPVPQPGHPTNYAHFHGPGDTPVPSTIFAPETITTELPNFMPSTTDTPSIILASGTLASGASVTASLEIHNEEIAGDKNGFGFSFFPTGTDTSQAVISGPMPTEQTDGVTPFSPFATTSVTDSNALPIEAATITVRDAANNLTDADVLSGPAALTEQSVGTYVLNPTLPSDLTSELHVLQFKEVGASDTLTLSVDNSQGNLVPAKASTLVTLVPPTPTPPPTVVGTAQEGQTLTASDSDTSATFQWQSLVNGTWTSISGATGSTYTVAEGDENNVLRVEATGTAGSADSLATDKVVDVTPTLSVTVSGTAQEAQVLTATPTLGTDGDDSASNVTYQWQRSTDNSTWSNISGATGGNYTPTTADAGDFVRTVASFSDDTGQSATANSSGTLINPPPGVNNFAVLDQTTEQSSLQSGTPYTGPAFGITNEFIDITPDNLDIAAITPNVFIHTGDGNDGINVSSANGHNTLDGEGGSNFLVGGNGNDTFYVNDLTAKVPSWTTMVGMHAGDAATVWGVTPADFQLTWLDGGGAAGYTGLTLYATAANKPEVALTLAGMTTADIASGRLDVQFAPQTAGHNSYMEISVLR